MMEFTDDDMEEEKDELSNEFVASLKQKSLLWRSKSPSCT
jgi:hypothetical protein